MHPRTFCLAGMAMIPGMAAAPMVQPSIGPVALKLESSHVMTEIDEMCLHPRKLTAGTPKIGGL